MTNEHKRKLPGTILALGFVSLLNDSASEMIYPLLPVFLTSILGASPAFLGVIEGIAEATASLLKLFSGQISDRLKRRKVFAVIGYALATLTRPLIGAASSAYHVLIARFLDRTGKGIRTAPRDALIAEAVEPTDFGRAFGFHRSMDHLGAVIGPLIAFILLSSMKMDLRSIFWLSTVPGVIGVIILIIFVKERTEASPKIKRSFDFNLKNTPANFKRFIAAFLIFTLGNSSDAFLLLRASAVGIPKEQLPLLWIVLHIVKFSTSLPGGVLSDKIGRRPLIIGGWFVYALIYAGFAFATSALPVWILFGAYGIYFGLTEGVEKAFVADMFPPERRGTAFGFYHFVLGAAALPASIIFGFLWTTINVQTAFLSGSALAIAASFLLILTVKEEKRL